jgi:hypothetical protein
MHQVAVEPLLEVVIQHERSMPLRGRSKVKFKECIECIRRYRFCLLLWTQGPAGAVSSFSTDR